MEPAEEVTMSNLEKAKEAYRLFNRRDIDGFVNLHPHNVIYEIMGEPDVPYAGIYRGREELRSLIQKMEEVIELRKFEPIRFIMEGDYIAVLVDVIGIVRATGRKVDRDQMHLLKFRNGKCIELREFSDTNLLVRSMR